MQEIRIERVKTPKEKPDWNNLGFGNYFTDHMFILDYAEGKGWHDARIIPYGPLTIDPSSMVLHYGQEIFEGLKAYRTKTGQVQLFRPIENIRRMNRSAVRLCIPEVDEELFLKAIVELVRTDISWVPKLPGTSLYIRPFIIATDAHLGVHASLSYSLIIILSPVSAYYPEGLDPVSILIEDEDVRSVKGGTGEAKTGGNYAATIRAQTKANKKGYTQVLWLDGVHRKYIEEVGTMNVMFKIGGKVVTPPLIGTILPGITRKSCIELLKYWNVPVEERLISIDELEEAADSGKLEEAFGTGTAAVVSPIKEFCMNGKLLRPAVPGIGALTQRLYDELTGIQWGEIPDPYGWIVKV